jgi:hypothetical protein
MMDPSVDLNDVPVVNYARMRRLNPKPDPAQHRFNKITLACMVISTAGFLYLVKRYRDKRAREQPYTTNTLRRSGTHLFS